MKKGIIIIFSLVTLALINACSDDEKAVSKEQAFLNKISGTWMIGNGVFVDGVNITDQYTNFSIFFNKDINFKAFEVENGGVTFPLVVDLYTFVSEDFTVIERGSDGTVMTIEMPDKNSLTLTFSLLPEGGRVSGTYGDFEFKLKRQ